METVKVFVLIRVEKSSGHISESSYQDCYESEDTCLQNLAQSICYAIPKHDFPCFEVIEIFKDGKSVGHGEI